MSITKFMLKPRSYEPQARRPGLRALVVAGWVCFAVACGSDDEQPNTWVPPLPIDGSVRVAESGVPDPVVVPPPVVQPPPVMDAALPMAVVDAGVMDASRMDASATRDASADTSVAAPDAAPKPDAAVVSDGGMGGGMDPSAANPCGSDPEPLAANIRISEIAAYQVVKIPLYRNNAWVTTRNATLVQGKKTLVRAFVAPQTGYTARALRGVLTLDNEGTKSAFVSSRTISAASTEASADSTFEFQLDGTQLKGATQLSVSVLETTCTPPAASSTGARLPASGAQALNADAIPKLRVVIVPITLAGRTPDTGEAQLTKIKEAFLAYYPVAQVEVTARAPVSSTITARSDGGGWSEILNLVGRTRSSDAPAGSVYYYGVMLPAANFQTYCRTGCVLGLAPLTRVVSRANQIGLGVGFIDENTISTAVHEIGHAHGLPHAPCTRGGTIQGADTAFPYSGAKIGSWGWDSRSNKLLSPMTYVDIMSYCTPEWISDYNYTKLATRSKAVNTAAYVFNSDLSAPAWHGLILYANGDARWSGVTTRELPGELSAARVLDAHGSVLTTIEVARVELSESADSFLYMPEPQAGWAAIDLGERVVQLGSVGAALE